MAYRLQKLFSVEAEFDDEDFLLAVKDVEKQVSAPVPPNSRCLKPLLSGLRAPSNTIMPPQDLVNIGPSKAMSPVLQIQTSIRRFGEGDCLSKVESDQATSPLVAGFKVQTELATLSAERKQSCASSTRFKFVSRCPALLPTGDAPYDEELDNQLLLAACTDLEEPDARLHLEPSRAHCGSREPMGDIGIGDTVTAKRLRVANSMMLVSPVGLENSPLERTQKATSVGVCFQSVEASPKLNLRPTAMRSSLSQSNQGLSTNTGTLPPTDCQLLKPIQATLDKTVAGSNSQCLPLVRHPSSFPLASPPPKPSMPRIPSQGFFMPRMANSGARLPPMPRIPNQGCFGPQMANSGARLLTAYGQAVASVEIPSASPKASCSAALTGNLQTPVVTNHLVRLVTAANKTPQPTAHISLRVKTRRFPGPAGILPHQPDGKNLEEILISTPQTPTHGALAKLQTEEMPASQQPTEEEFGRGPWVAMKTELGLDERDPSCFLRTYSVVMVLRKAALKQLPKNKVPNMAVIIKSLMRTNVDAGAVFKDATGEMQGTIHRLLLEEKESELKAGSVLLLKQVGVFSPSYRNHYLNVTPNNLVKIYPPGFSGGTPPQLCHEIRERMEMTAPQVGSEFQQDPLANASVIIATTEYRSRHGHEMDKNCCQDTSSLSTLPGTCGSDDLDQLLGELPDDFFSSSDVLQSGQ
ncbi:homologous recombination OB-fold protein [Hemicordylus capensis]|uniref:homologous recombination OB-fold protein n=1 Tax=Hemicordylus capensis TaxID=884348 RepID=UPI00230327E2|nr:homologous recombination OB-fold protein [Hemicordylus capensis]